MALEREVEERPPACSKEENIKPDGSLYSDEESRMIGKRYLHGTIEQLNALDPEFKYCATRAAKKDPYEGKVGVAFHIDREGRARVVDIAPEIENVSFRACLVSVFERATFTPHEPLACISYHKPFHFKLPE